MAASALRGSSFLLESCGPLRARSSGVHTGLDEPVGAAGFVDLVDDSEGVPKVRKTRKATAKVGKGRDNGYARDTGPLSHISPQEDAF
jgi:hypothetical protein